MAFLSLNISDFRNFKKIELTPAASGFNLIYGQNGSGKTSLLEAIYYLSFGRSFRSQAASSIIRHSTPSFSLFAQIANQSGSQTIPVGLERTQEGTIKIRISGNDANSVAELVSLVPVQIINSNCHQILEGSPNLRRKYLDWGAFYLHQDYIRIWRRFERALKQRNAALRGQIPLKEMQIWTEEVIESGIQLNQVRQEYVSTLSPVLTRFVNELLQLSHWEIRYKSGWDEELNYRDALIRTFERDTFVGHTSCGPHRSDLEITINNLPAKDILSRGQQKLFVCAMILSQCALLHDCIQKKPVYLVDDLPSELDNKSMEKVVTLLSKQKAQIFVTAIEREALPNSLNLEPIKMFHVKHGMISEGC